MSRADSSCGRVSIVRACRRYYVDLHDVESALPLLQQLTEATAVVHGATHPHHMSSLRNYAGALQKAGRYAEADAPYVAHADKMLTAHGEASVEYVEALSHVGVNCRHMGELERAERLFNTAMRALEAAGSNETTEAMLLNNLANVKVSAGSHNEGVALLERALALEAKLAGERSQRWVWATELKAGMPRSSKLWL